MIFWHGGKMVPSTRTQNPRNPQDWEPRTLGHSKFTVIRYQRLPYQIHLKWLFSQDMVKKWEPHQIPPGTLLTQGPVMTAMTFGRSGIIY